MTKVMTILGTRPEIIKMSRIITEIDKFFDHTLVHTGQNYDYELNEIFFNDLEVRKPDQFLDVASNTVGETIGNIIAKSDKVLEKINPDALILYGDTNSCLSAIAAKRRKIPIFHFEAGNRCFDLRVPEEINRKIVDHTSDINFTLTDHAKTYLIMEGIRPDRIFKTGSHMYEVLERYKNNIKNSNILKELNIKANKYFLVSVHREENVDNEKNFISLINILNEISENYELPIIVSTHPRTEKKLTNLGISRPKNLIFMKPFGFFDYIHLQQNSYCVISDSGTITEESSILKFPAINIRNAHERPEGMDYGSVIMAGINLKRIRESIKITIDHFKNNKESFYDIADYKNLHVSKQVTRTITSYIDTINRDVWKKEIL